MLRVRDVHRSNDLRMAEKIKNSRIVQLGRGVGRGVVVVTRGARGVSGSGGSGGGVAVVQRRHSGGSGGRAEVAVAVAQRG